MWAMEKTFNQETGIRPATIRLTNESEVVIEISNEKKNKIIPTIESLCFTQYNAMIQVEIFTCDKINQSKGLIYIQNCNIPDNDEYCCELKKEYNLSDMIKKNLDKNLKPYFHYTPTDFQRKRTTETYRNPGRPSQEIGSRKS